MYDDRTGKIRELDKEETEKFNKAFQGEAQEFERLEAELKKEDKVMFIKHELIDIKGCKFCVIEIDTKLNTITLMSEKLIKRRL